MSGQQWRLTKGDLEAVVVEAGGGLRTLRRGDADVLAGYAEDAMAPSGRGQLLIPWPNRIGDGRYTFDGEDHELPITERSTGTASHGLVRWGSWRASERDEDRVVLRHEIHPRPGYPFALDLRVAWQVDDRGVRCDTLAVNVGDRPAPFGYGAHPYLAVAGPVAATPLTVPAGRVVLVDDVHQLPTGTEPVDGTAFDLRGGPVLGDRSIDHAYTDLARGEDGCWTVTMPTPAGLATVWGGPGLDWVQVFTGKSDPADLPAGLTPGVAVEPLSCPPDAFRSGDGLVRLAPGEAWSAQWGVEVA